MWEVGGDAQGLARVTRYNDLNTCLGGYKFQKLLEPPCVEKAPAKRRAGGLGLTSVNLVLGMALYATDGSVRYSLLNLMRE